MTVPSPMAPVRRVFRTDRWIPLSFIAFFVVVFIANAVFVVLALGTWNGVVVDNAYEQGLAYNEKLKAARAAKTLGWRTELSLEADGEGANALVLRFFDADGHALNGLTVEGELGRPTHDGADRVVIFRSSGAGTYRAALIPPILGQWDLTARAAAPDAMLRIKRRVHVR